MYFTGKEALRSAIYLILEVAVFIPNVRIEHSVLITVNATFSQALVFFVEELSDC